MGTCWTKGPSSNQANSVRTGGLCVNTAETILPSELTEKTRLCWRGTDNQRRTWSKRIYGVGGLREGKDRAMTVCQVSLPERDGESEWTEYRMRNKWQEWGYKRKWRLELYSGPWDWEDSKALEFSQLGLMGLLCPNINHAEMQRSASIHKELSRATFQIKQRSG